MIGAKRLLKRNCHNVFFKGLAGFGRSLNRFYENRNHDIYSNGELTILKKISEFDPQIIVDGGANTGDYSLAIKQVIPDCKLYSFEPVESTFQQLVENVQDCQNVIPINKGLFKENCSREINIFNSDAHSSLYDIEGLSYNANQKVVIELVRGDDFMREHQIDCLDFLKLDVEGAEFDALKGFENSLKHGNIKAIQFEYGYINISTKKLLIDYYKFFESHNYVLGKIFPKVVEFRKYEFKYEDFLGPNFIAVSKSEHKLIDLLSSK